MKICACRPAGISGAATTPQDQSPRQSGIAGPCFGMPIALVGMSAGTKSLRCVSFRLLPFKPLAREFQRPAILGDNAHDLIRRA